MQVCANTQLADETINRACFTNKLKDYSYYSASSVIQTLIIQISIVRTTIYLDLPNLLFTINFIVIL